MNKREEEFLASLIQSIVDDLNLGYIVEIGDDIDGRNVIHVSAAIKMRIKDADVSNHWRGCQFSTNLHDQESIELIKRFLKGCSDDHCEYCEFSESRREQLSPDAPLHDGCIIRDGKVYKI